MTTDLATSALHESYTASNSVLIGDGTGLLFTNVLYVPTMSKNIISVSALYADNLVNVLVFLLFLSRVGLSHGSHPGLRAA